MIIEITRKGWIIKGIIITSENLFADTGVFVQVQTQSSGKIVVPVANPKNSEELMELKIIVG